ncbi:MAG: hypothetical protein LBF15_02870 [Candidatus Peribacteria bacterium]|nr:hypothetical protein [Candidatus Peribacteria bacterium]
MNTGLIIQVPLFVDI